MAAGAAAVGNIITIFPKLLSGRTIPEEGIVLEDAAAGAIKFIRSVVKKQLRSCCFELCLGTKQLTDKKASAAKLEIQDGATITIVRISPTEDQWQKWRNFESAGNPEWVQLNPEIIEKIGWPCLEQALLQTHASTVDFHACVLGCDEVEIIAEALSVNGNIKGLSLCDNEVGDDGAVLLAQVLKASQNLELIHLSKNWISDIGAVAIAEALAINNKLKHIFLGGNAITNDGAIAFAKALKINHVLEKIVLNANKIHDDGAVEIAKAIEANAGLTHVWLNGNPIGDVGKNALEKANQTRNKQGKPLDTFKF